MTKQFRNGAIGALLDEYERAISDLKRLIKTIPDNTLTVVTDPQSTDENCRSLQAILSHVVSSGYGYATSIHNLQGNNVIRPDKTFHFTIKAYLEDLDRVFSYTENVFAEINDSQLEQSDHSLKIKAGWGQVYDIEQMAEHAIVHILRHRRQIEKINLKINEVF